MLSSIAPAAVGLQTQQSDADRRTGRCRATRGAAACSAHRRRAERGTAARRTICDPQRPRCAPHHRDNRPTRARARARLARPAPPHLPACPAAAALGRHSSHSGPQPCLASWVAARESSQARSVGPPSQRCRRHAALCRPTAAAVEVPRCSATTEEPSICDPIAARCFQYRSVRRASRFRPRPRRRVPPALGALVRRATAARHIG